MTARRGQRAPLQVRRHDCELATLMAAARRPVQAELWDDVQVHCPLVVNAYEPHLASLNDNQPAGRCYSQRPAARSQDAPVRGDVAEVPFVGERHKLAPSPGTSSPLRRTDIGGPHAPTKATNRSDGTVPPIG